MIQSFMDFPKRNCNFYEHNGSVKVDFINQVVKKQRETPIGWFRFRSATPLRPSLREFAIHQQLEALFSGSQPLLFGLFTFDQQDFGATHTFDYKFMHIKSNGR